MLISFLKLKNHPVLGKIKKKNIFFYLHTPYMVNVQSVEDCFFSAKRIAKSSLLEFD